MGTGLKTLNFETNLKCIYFFVGKPLKPFGIIIGINPSCLLKLLGSFGTILWTSNIFHIFYLKLHFVDWNFLGNITKFALDWDAFFLCMGWALCSMFLILGKVLIFSSVLDLRAQFLAFLVLKTKFKLFLLITKHISKKWKKKHEIFPNLWKTPGTTFSTPKIAKTRMPTQQKCRFSGLFLLYELYLWLFCTKRILKS